MHLARTSLEVAWMTSEPSYLEKAGASVDRCGNTETVPGREKG